MNATTNHATLDAWLAEEAAVVARLNAGPGPGVARPDQVTGLTGLELMQAMLRGDLPYAAIAKTLDFTIVEVSEGRAVFQGTPGPAHLNPWAPSMAAGTPRCSTRPWVARCTP